MMGPFPTEEPVLEMLYILVYEFNLCNYDI